MLKRCTLTNRYNERPAWLAHLHATLDAAVYAAYGWVRGWESLGRRISFGRVPALNLERAADQSL